jgi:DNA-binding beta-propeller fold protein YncE
MGLLVVDLETLEVTKRINEIDEVAVSPDGRYILGIGDFWDWRTANGNAEITGYGLKVIDATTFEVVAHLMSGASFSVPTISPDGGRAYLLSEGEGYVENTTNHTRSCEQDCWRITVVDLDNLSVLGQRSLTGYVRLVSLTP